MKINKLFSLAKWSKPYVTGIFIFLIQANTIAQKEPNIQSLKSILESLEEHFDISFTYADENIENVEIAPPPISLDLNASLLYLEKHTGLVFIKLDDRFITISKPMITIKNICGFVFSKTSGDKLTDALIQMDKNVVYSNKNGYFEINNIESENLISFKYLGYETQYIEAGKFNGNECDTIYLTPAANKLNEVVVVNFMVEGINKNIDGAYIINTDKLGILPGLIEPDVLQTLQALPGIQSVNESISDINVRGGTNDQNLLLWDGIRMYQSGHFFGLISVFNPYLTNDITLIKNGSSPFLGDAVSGTIDIQSDNNVSNDFTGGAGINMINADVFVKIPLSSKTSLHLSARRSIADLIETPTYNQYFERAFGNTDITNLTNSTDSVLSTNQNFRFFDIGVKFLYDISEKDKLRVNFLDVNNEISYNESLSENLVESSKNSSLGQKSTASGISYIRNWNNKVNTSALLYFSLYDLNSINNDITNSQELIQENEIIDTGLKIDSRIAVTNQLDILSGYQFAEVGISNLDEINDPPYRRLIKRVIRSHALFSEVNYTSNSTKTNLRAGLRVNYLSKFSKWIAEPRIALNQKFLNYFSLEVLGEFKSQTATQVIDFQYDFLGVEKRRWVLSNEENIPIVQSRQISSGIHFQKNKLLISLEGYLKQVNGITSASQGFQNQFQYVQSTGNYLIKGIDFLINQKFGKASSWIGYSMANNTYDFDDFDPPQFPNNIDIRHALTVGSNYQSKHLLLSAGINWRTGKPYTQPAEGNSIVAGEINYDNPNSSRLEDYLRVDISAIYKFNLSTKIQGELGASIWNLLDNQNIINKYYQINNDGQLESIQQYALGLTPNLMFRINF